MAIRVDLIYKKVRFAAPQPPPPPLPSYPENSASASLPLHQQKPRARKTGEWSVVPIRRPGLDEEEKAEMERRLAEERDKWIVRVEEILRSSRRRNIKHFFCCCAH